MILEVKNGSFGYPKQKPILIFIQHGKSNKKA